MSKPVNKRTTTRAPTAPKTAAVKAARSAAKAADAPVAPRAPSAPAPSAKNILTAGIKALTNAHEEAVARQSRVFESLLGFGPARARSGDVAEPAQSLATTALDPFGFKKFEDVFDQRVARAMANLGVPTAEAFATLEAEVERLRETVARLEAQGRKR